MLLLTMSMSISAYATPTCEEVIRAADKALAAKQDQISARDVTIGDLKIMTKAQADEIAAKDRQLSAWYRSPYLWVVVGLGVGLYVGRK